MPPIATEACSSPIAVGLEQRGIGGGQMGGAGLLPVAATTSGTGGNLLYWGGAWDKIIGPGDSSTTARGPIQQPNPHTWQEELILRKALSPSAPQRPQYATITLHSAVIYFSPKVPFHTYLLFDVSGSGSLREKLFETEPASGSGQLSHP
ncbi:hypothetical protein XELAEV_18033444mg [Xenopus laevis]|uniref:Uncharacterized protein n=1 Tax=Xenopus laevis TaxID=8355 RepID=A0A974HDZ8_XENLA|nr:hypothetical protein XELAEV_18033444mg [Xenopus laevis]